jgi:copper chaperone NosL
VKSLVVIIVVPFLLLFMTAFVDSCSRSAASSAVVSERPVPLDGDNDVCELCRMRIGDMRFAAEMITDEGRVIKFDDVICLVQYFDMAKKLDLVSREKVKAYYFGDLETKRFVPADSSVFVRSSNYASVMGKLGSVIVFGDSIRAKRFLEKNGGRAIPFDDLWTYMGEADRTVRVFISKHGLDTSTIRIRKGQIVELDARAADDGVYNLQVTGFDFDGRLTGIRKGFFRSARIRGDIAGSRYPLYSSTLKRDVGVVIVE